MVIFRYWLIYCRKCSKITGRIINIKTMNIKDLEEIRVCKIEGILESVIRELRCKCSFQELKLFQFTSDINKPGFLYMIINGKRYYLKSSLFPENEENIRKLLINIFGKGFYISFIFNYKGIYWVEGLKPLDIRPYGNTWREA